MSIIPPQISDLITPSLVEKSVVAGAVGAGFTPDEKVPQFLLDHSFLGATSADWIKIIGATYVLVLLIEITIKYGSRLYKWIRNKISQ